LRTPSFEKALSRWVRKTHLFSNVPVFLPEAGVGEMLRVVHAVEAATRLPGYRHAVLSLALDIARHDFGPVGVFMGYDFHLAADGPRLIEVNTNAGGAFLNALLAKAQRACRLADQRSTISNRRSRREPKRAARSSDVLIDIDLGYRHGLRPRTH
jgi:hypothetical protein